MVRSNALASLLATAAAGLIAGAEAQLGNGDPIAGSYILEYATNSDGGLLNGLLDPVQSLLNLGLGINIDLHYDYDIFKGALISLDQPDDSDDLISKLLGLDTIQNVWQNRAVQLEPLSNPLGSLPLGSNPLGSLPLGSNPLGSAAGANPLGSVLGGSAAGSNPVGSLLGSAAGSSSNPLGGLLGGGGSTPKSRRDESSQPGVYSTHIATQVDLLHAKGIYGNGTKIAILDTGVDYTHPCLGGCFGVGCLVSFGRDYVGDDYDAGTTPAKPDPDPLDQCGDGHGSHVTGIIAAQPGCEFGVLGAAPAAEIGMYRILSCSGSGDFSIIVQAALDAFQDGANIITMSASAADGWTDTPFTVIFDRIATAGVIVTTSAGNTGDIGLFAAKLPSEGKHVSSISSFVNPVQPEFGKFTSYSVDGGDPQELYWLPGSPDAWPKLSLPIYASTFNHSDAEAGCTLPDDTPDLSGYIVIARMAGGCSSDVQAKAAAAKGAKYLIGDGGWYIDAPLFTVDNASTIGIVATAGVRSEVVDDWLDLLAANKTVVVTMAPPDSLPWDVRYKASPLAGYADFFSTYGPTFEMDIKPQFGTPGGTILSTIPKKIDPSGLGFAIYSGTSMSTPLAAAIHALVAQVRGTYDPATLQRLVSATAHPGPYHNAYTYWEAAHGHSWPNMLAPVSKQGTGIIQAYDAAYATVLLSRTNIAFNDTANLVPDANFTITNLGTQDVTFTLGHRGAATVYYFNQGSPLPATFQKLKVTDEYATIAFAQSQVTVPAGGEATVSLTLTPPALNGRLYPLYSGYITGNGTNGENFNLPYQGLVGNLIEMPIMSDAFLSNSSDPDSNPIKNGTVEFVIPKDGCVDCSNFTVPVASIRPSFGTRILDVKLIDWETGNNLGSVRTDDNYPCYSTNRYDPIDSVFNGTMHDNSTAPAGTYVFEFSALKIYADPSQDTSFERKRSTPFSISYA